MLIINWGTASIYLKIEVRKRGEVEQTMLKHFTLEYWIDDNWYVGRLKEVPGVFSQGKSLEELEENVRDVYYLMVKDEISHWAMAQTQTKEIGIEV